eukprot:505955-Pelagomonas_calceolata.AAC.5
MQAVKAFIKWLLSPGSFTLAAFPKTAQMLAVLMVQAVQAFIGWLLSSGSFERAASMSWRLLGRSAPAWERWVYLFAQARHLPLLAPHLPTELAASIQKESLTSKIALARSQLLGVCRALMVGIGLFFVNTSMLPSQVFAAADVADV